MLKKKTNCILVLDFQCIKVFRLFLLLHKLLDIFHGDQYFYLFFYGITFLSIIIVKWWKWQNLLKFLVFMLLIIECEYHMKSFIWIKVNISTYIVVRSVPNNSRDCQAIINRSFGAHLRCHGKRLIALRRFYSLKMRVSLSSHVFFFYLNMIIYYLFHVNKSYVKKSV